MTLTLVYFLLFILPLVVIPVTISPFEAPKVILVELAIEILLVLRIIRDRKHSLKALISPQTIFIGILFLLSLDTQLLFKPTGAFFGNPFRLQGQFLFWHLLIFSFLAQQINLNKISSKFFLISFYGLLIGTLVLGVYKNRAFGTLGEPNALATTALLIFPFVFNIKPNLFKIFNVILAFVIILLSGSRAGLTGFIVEIMFLFFTLNLKISYIKTLTLCIIMILLSLLLPFAQTNGWFENRAEIWQTAFTSGLTSPLIGQGFGTVQQVIHDTAVIKNNNIQYQVVDSSHNFLLDFWIQGGLVGVVCILLLLYFSLDQMVKKHNFIYIATFLGLTTAMLFNPVSVVNLAAFWYLIGHKS